MKKRFIDIVAKELKEKFGSDLIIRDVVPVENTIVFKYAKCDLDDFHLFTKVFKTSHTTPVHEGAVFHFSFVPEDLRGSGRQDYRYNNRVLKVSGKTFNPIELIKVKVAEVIFEKEDAAILQWIKEKFEAENLRLNRDCFTTQNGGKGVIDVDINGDNTYAIELDRPNGVLKVRKQYDHASEASFDLNHPRVEERVFERVIKHFVAHKSISTLREVVDSNPLKAIKCIDVVAFTVLKHPGLQAFIQDYKDIIYKEDA